MENFEIKFDEITAKNYSLESIRKRMSYVSQQPLIFNASVYENVSYVKPFSNKEEVIKELVNYVKHEMRKGTRINIYR